MEKDNSIFQKEVSNSTNYLETVKDLVDRIHLLQEASGTRYKRYKDFNRDWQEKCTHPEFFKIIIPLIKNPEEFSKEYPYMIDFIRKNFVYYKCPVCGLIRKETPSSYVKELTIQRHLELDELELAPVSESAQVLSQRRKEELTSLESEINLEQENIQKELDTLLKEANKIADLLDSELGIHRIVHISHYRHPDPIYNDMFYPD